MYFPVIVKFFLLKSDFVCVCVCMVDRTTE